MYIFDSNQTPSIRTIESVAEYPRVYPSAIRWFKTNQLRTLSFDRD